MGLELQIPWDAAPENRRIPGRDAFERWVEAALAATGGAGSVVVRIVGDDESRSLNHAYRHQDRPTNVLSFPFEPPPGIDDGHLGDLVICAPVVDREAREQEKNPEAHWAHMVVHGILHLRGFDHEEPDAAARMEAREIAILAQLGFSDPYAIPETDASSA